MHEQIVEKPTRKILYSNVSNLNHKVIILFKSQEVN